MEQGKLVEGFHKLGLLFPANEQIIGTIKRFVWRIRNFIKQNFLAALFPPVLENSLMGDAEEPASKFVIVVQSANVFGGGDKRFLDKIQAGLLVMDQFENINIERQLVSSKECVPGRG